MKQRSLINTEDISHEIALLNMEEKNCKEDGSLNFSRKRKNQRITVMGV